MSTFLRSCVLGAAYYRAVNDFVIPHLLKRGLKANQITIAGTILAAVVPLGFWVHPMLGLSMILLSGLADSLDGPLARSRNSTSPFGAFLDSSLDRLSDFFYLTGFWVMLWFQSASLSATVMVFFAQLATMMISYVKARAEALDVCCQTGLMERGMRVLYFLLWALLLILLPNKQEWVLWIGLVLYTGLTLYTVAQRILHVRAQLAGAVDNHKDLNF